ncbi:GlsB/YeaQ/YmgE family stress response membrane protein [Falsochrobactrum ovis]|uniref:Putative membrane protein YeaQ/YmgE (Transglycosylase-associated protein family) n=1 Tax=Falsochrobactrum ovis TaxID=1293442 RepID=A0A364JW20_9HYPH|nr:GlsB/YeaQ/YmgE family stress response membrane protein [Falsochrobactrum ovis]RAK30094.1 putative membrane protein YeaQ/YmgE (transglycosylase-associated protein family) [Falsochrobactrum ovis]
MEPGSLPIFLFVGLIAGWLAGKLVQGGGFGLIGNIIVGVIGAFFAGWLLPQLGLSVGGGMIASIVNAFIGAAILLFIIKIIKRV